MPLYTLNFSATRTCKPLSRNVADLSLVISFLKVTFVLLQTNVLVLWSILLFDFLTIFIHTREQYANCEFINHFTASLCITSFFLYYTPDT